MASDGHSRSNISGRHFTTPHYNRPYTGFNSKGSENTATEVTKNRRFLPPHYHLTPPRYGTPTSISMSHILPKSRVPVLYFCCWYYGSILFQMLRKTHHLRSRVRYWCSRSSKVVNFGSNRKRLSDFLLVILASSRTVAEITAAYLVKSAKFSYPLWFNAVDRSDLFRISRVLHEADSKDFVILACVVLICSQGVTNTQTHCYSEDMTLHCKLCWCPVVTCPGCYNITAFLNEFCKTTDDKNLNGSNVTGKPHI